DIEIVMKQYGPPMDHKNKEAMSRFISPLFNQTIALFGLLISNMPESIMLTTKGHIKYQFRVFEALTVIYIEVKLDIGKGDEYLNPVVQLIAKADGLYPCQYQCPVLTFFYIVINRM
ncbi:hypothetical protein BYT27DRAFT_7091765, partial [Phlegmacium glaucopus]